MMKCETLRAWGTDSGLLVLRLVVGLSMAFAHGWGKIQNPPVEFVKSLGFPLPVVFAWAAALAEFVGALMVAFGAGARIGAAFLAFTMGVAAFYVHAADPFGQKELALLYLAASLAVVLAGAGRFSLDHLVCSRRAKKA